MAESNTQQMEDYYKVEKAINFIQDNFKSQPSLEEIASCVNLSKCHFNRLFKRWAGISPIQFLHFITLDHTKKELSKSRSVLDASLDSGLSGPGRLHDLFVNFDAMTPGDFKKKGAGLRIEYGFGISPFGECLMAMTEKGICSLAFVEEDRQQALSILFDAWPAAVLVENNSVVMPIISQIFDLKGTDGELPFNLLLRGTNFQVNVWKALLKIPSGRLVNYQEIAHYIGKPKAFRAVASAIAANPIAYLIPCHRVIAKSGHIHQYRWGAGRKKAIIGWEAAREIGS